MAAAMTPTPTERVTAGAHGALVAALAVLVPIGAGAALALAVSPSIPSKLFPWVTARALGIAAYLALTALVTLGTWMRHPWRLRVRFGHAESYLRAHAALGMATIALVVAHLAFLATDRYAGVGWIGALLPGASSYRRLGVGLGVVALDLMVAIAATARLAGRRGARHWLPVHRLALATFALTWFHGVLSGIDVAVLRPMYVITGTFVAVLGMSRRFARAPSSLAPGSGEPVGVYDAPLAAGAARGGSR
jgi:hypothetical protein